MNYWEHLLGGGEPVLEPRHKSGWPRERFVCPVCERVNEGETIASCDRVPSIDADWICDGCWTDLARHLAPLSDTVKPDSWVEWLFRFRSIAEGSNEHLQHYKELIPRSLENESINEEASGDPSNRRGRIQRKIARYQQGLPEPDEGDVE